jgi:hypothetical protein
MVAVMQSLKRSQGYSSLFKTPPGGASKPIFLSQPPVYKNCKQLIASDLKQFKIKKSTFNINEKTCV